jgi:hypothetical protein
MNGRMFVAKILPLKIGKRTTTVFPAHPVLHEVHYKDWP